MSNISNYFKNSPLNNCTSIEGKLLRLDAVFYMLCISAASIVVVRKHTVNVALMSKKVIIFHASMSHHYVHG